jgi:hypothetical protein
MRMYQPIVIVGALALLTAACQSASPTAVQVVLPTADLPLSTETPILIQEIEAQEYAQESPAPVELVPAAPVEPRGGLAATNPATLNLANGTPTFVEFFAFW